MSGFIGDFQVGEQPPWPVAEIAISHIFNQPSWTRPTVDGGYIPPKAKDNFTGAHGFAGGGAFSGGSGFVGGISPGSTWVPPVPGTPGRGGTIIVVRAGGTVSLDISANRSAFYTIEVYDPDGDKITPITQWIAGQLTRRLDTASDLKFTVPYDAEGVADLVRPNTVWLRDRWGFVIDTFQIQKRRPTGDGDASYYEIECIGAIAQLGEEPLFEYNDAEPTDTVLAHVTALLDLQLRDNAITLGEIDPEIADIQLPFYAVDTTIHEALLQLQLALPKATRGRFYVDAQRRFQWRLVTGDTTEQVITRSANVKSINAETDYSSIVNRIYMMGEGQDTADRLTLVDAGEANEYIEDTDSITAWGLSPARKVDRRIRHADTLLRVAQRILEEFSDPPVMVDVELLDLAKADEAPEGWRDIEIGGRYRVVDTDLSLDTSVEIVGIETDMTRPVPIRVELANQTRSLSDLISRLVEALQQPLDVDGDRYPTMGRNYTSRDARDPRAGDVRYAPPPQMHNGTDWEDIGAGEELHYEASSKSGLPYAGDVDVRSVGRVDGGGDDNGMFCVPNPDKTGWDALNFFE